jgi:hypothetical protein
MQQHTAIFPLFSRLNLIDVHAAMPAPASPTSLKKLSGLFCHGLGTLNLSVYGPSHSAPLVKEKIKLMAARTQAQAQQIKSANGNN